MAAAAPTIEGMLQQVLDNIQELTNRSIETNTRVEDLSVRVGAIELAQSLNVYPSDDRVQGLNPLSSSNKRTTRGSRDSSPTNSESGDKESSEAHLGTKDDLAAV